MTSDSVLGLWFLLVPPVIGFVLGAMYIYYRQDVVTPLSDSAWLHQKDGKAYYCFSDSCILAVYYDQESNEITP